MSGAPILPQKRPRDLSASLTEVERKIYDLILSRGDMGILKTEIHKGLSLQAPTAQKILKSLTEKFLIKLLPSANRKGKQFYFAYHIEPSSEISGGEWYTDGALDTAFIEALQKACFAYLRTKGVATPELICDFANTNKFFNVRVEVRQFEHILESMVLGGDIEKVVSTGMGEFEDIMVRRHCYRIPKKGGGAAAAKVAAFSSIPCGVCPRINDCSPDGIISPRTCVFYQRWLGEDDSKKQDDRKPEAQE